MEHDVDSDDDVESDDDVKTDDVEKGDDVDTTDDAKTDDKRDDKSDDVPKPHIFVLTTDDGIDAADKKASPEVVPSVADTPM